MFKTIVEQKRLSELKGGFISNMTHEFNTPIATIALACEAIEDDDLIPSQEKKNILPFIHMIRQENQRLEVLVESILQSSLLEKQNILWGKDPVDIIEVAQQVMDNTLFRVGKEQCKIELLAEKKPVIVLCDKLHFRNLISNLVENAVKYSNDIAAVRIEIKQNTDNVVLSVSDEGIGIKKEHINKIFDKLYRVPTGDLHNVKGFGLGLNYVKRICDGYNWDIDVKSHFGKGTTFVVTIKKNENE